ncbi:MAG: ABC transporter ATP-binding protein [Myxococcaceae bacterium]|jgi:putative ABC transport system ATP-binding protein|nr:ABC transporter ATP-binding protein [Myxococcaceae bacterium]
MDSSGPAEASLLRFTGVHRHYGEGDAIVRALDGVDLAIAPSEFVAITGASGSGKSTALSILGCLDLPTAGAYFIEGHPVQSLSGDVLAALRNAKFGFIFQSYNLLARTSALDNVSLPLIYAGVGALEREARAYAALSSVGLAGREDARPNQLSGGQQQRIAIARALVNDPEVILADEPTGNLDSKTGDEIMQLLSSLHLTRGITVIMVTHDLTCASWAKRRVVFRDGRIASDTPVSA